MLYLLLLLGCTCVHCQVLTVTASYAVWFPQNAPCHLGSRCTVPVLLLHRFPHGDCWIFTGYRFFAASLVLVEPHPHLVLRSSTLLCTVLLPYARPPVSPPFSSFSFISAGCRLRRIFVSVLSFLTYRSFTCLHRFTATAPAATATAHHSALTYLPARLPFTKFVVFGSFATPLPLHLHVLAPGFLRFYTAFSFPAVCCRQHSSLVYLYTTRLLSSAPHAVSRGFLRSCRLDTAVP